MQADGSAYFHACPLLYSDTGAPVLREGHRDENIVHVEVPKPSVWVEGLHTVKRWADDTVHYFERRILHEGAGVTPVEPKG